VHSAGFKEWPADAVSFITDVFAKDLPPWLARRSRKGRSVRGCCSNAAPNPSFSNATAVHCRTGSPLLSAPNIETTSEAEHRTPREQPDVPSSVWGAASHTAVVVPSPASHNNELHCSSDQSKVAAMASHSAPTDNKRYVGHVSWWRGSYGWVDCQEVTTKYGARQVFLHFSDCAVKPRQWQEIEFSLTWDNKGDPKAVNARLADTKVCNVDLSKSVNVRQVEAQQRINARDYFAQPRGSRKV